MDRPLLFVSYEQLDAWLGALQPRLLQEHFACIVGILRGGAPLALMASHATGASVAFIRYDRSTRQPCWDSSLPVPAAGSRVLLCEDIAGSGFTLTDSMAFLQSLGLNVRTLTAAHDELSRIKPDYSNDATGYFTSFPWERHAHTEAYRADWARTGGGARRGQAGGDMLADHHYAPFAIDLDGILLPDIPAARYDSDLAGALAERDQLLPYAELPPHLELRDARAIITGRPEVDRARTQRWLDQHGFGGIELVMRDPACDAEDINGTIAHKVRAALRLRCTWFIESELRQAALISEAAPLLRVVWWDALSGAGRLVSARQWLASRDPVGG